MVKFIFYVDLLIFRKWAFFIKKRQKTSFLMSYFLWKRLSKFFFAKIIKIKLKITQKKILGFFSSKLAEIPALNAALCEKNAIFSVSLRVISKNLWLKNFWFQDSSFSCKDESFDISYVFIWWKNFFFEKNAKKTLFFRYHASTLSRIALKRKELEG